VFHESVTPPVEKVRRPAVKVEEPIATGEPTPTSRRSTSSEIHEELSEASEGTAHGGSSTDPDVVDIPNPRQAEEIAAERLSSREVWEPPPGAAPRPPLDAPAQARQDWLRERLQIHVDQAIERYRIEGLTRGQEAALVDTPGLQRAFRGSRIDQFAKESIVQDAELAEIITAPNFINEPDVLDSVFPTWFDMTTRAQWAAHLRTYGARYGVTAGHHLPSD